jgi:hypothetical protein
MSYSSRRCLVTNRQKMKEGMIEYVMEFLSSRQLTYQSSLVKGTPN